MDLIYLDWAASAPILPEALKTYMTTTENLFGNPSSLHSAGRSAKTTIEDSRTRVARILDVKPQDLTFTSGGTESNNLVYSQLVHKRQKGILLIEEGGHSSLTKPGNIYRNLGFTTKPVKMTPRGQVDIPRLERSLTPEVQLVAVSLVNSVTGAINPIKEIVSTIRDFEKKSGARIWIHGDGVQALGKIPLRIREWNLDSLSFSSHKIGAPRGTGLLWTAKPFQPLFVGGGQERNLRPGTESTAGIAALASALEYWSAHQEEIQNQAGVIKAKLIDAASNLPGVAVLPAGVLTDPESFSPFILQIAFPPVPSEVILRILDDAGIAISHGSACSANEKKRQADYGSLYGIDETTANSTVRFSWGPTTTEKEIDTTISEIQSKLIPLMSSIR